jgi:hypothetical protein
LTKRKHATVAALINFDPSTYLKGNHAQKMKIPERIKIKKETCTDIVMFVLLALAIWILIIIL